MEVASYHPSLFGRFTQANARANAKHHGGHKKLVGEWRCRGPRILYRACRIGSGKAPNSPFVGFLDESLITGMSHT